MKTIENLSNEERQALINSARRGLIALLKKHNKKEYVTLPNTTPELLKLFLFEGNTCAFDFNLIKKLDLSNVSFDGIDITSLDFTGSKGVFINPQTVYNKSLANTILNSVTFIEFFDDCIITGANFTGSHDAKINPERVANKDLSNTTLTNVTFIDFFNDCNIVGANFTGSFGAVIKPRKLRNHDLSNAILTDVLFTDSFDDCIITGADFTGAKEIKPLPGSKYDKNQIWLADVKKILEKEKNTKIRIR